MSQLDEGLPVIELTDFLATHGEADYDPHMALQDLDAFQYLEAKHAASILTEMAGPPPLTQRDALEPPLEISSDSENEEEPFAKLPPVGGKFTAPFHHFRPNDLDRFLDQEMIADWHPSGSQSPAVPDPVLFPEAVPVPDPDPVPEAAPVPDPVVLPEAAPVPDPDLMTPTLTLVESPFILRRTKKILPGEDLPEEDPFERLVQAHQSPMKEAPAPVPEIDEEEFRVLASSVPTPKVRVQRPKSDELTIKTRAAVKIWRANYNKVLFDIERWRMFGPMPFLPTQIREISLRQATGPQEWHLDSQRCRAAAAFHGERAVSSWYQKWYDSHLLPGIKMARVDAHGSADPGLRVPGELLVESTMSVVKLEDDPNHVDVPFRVVGSQQTDPMVWLRAPRASTTTGSSPGTIGTSPLETSWIASPPSTCAIKLSEELKEPPTSRAGSPFGKDPTGPSTSSSELLVPESTWSNSKEPSSKRKSTAPKRRRDATLTSASIDADPFPLETRAQATALISTLWPMPCSMAGTPDAWHFDIRCPGCDITKASILSLAPSKWPEIRRSHPLCGGTGAPLGLARLLPPTESFAAPTEPTASTSALPVRPSGGMATAQEWESFGMTLGRATAVILTCYTCSIGIPYAWK